MVRNLPRQNTLFYGDNLDIIRDHIPDESVDLICVDPPFSSRNYNVLLRDRWAGGSMSQTSSTDDSWIWNHEVERTYRELIVGAQRHLAIPIGFIRENLGASLLAAFYIMMATRLVELHRVLKPTGALYLQVDPVASHYLRLILDALFGADNFRNQIIWPTTFSSSKATPSSQRSLSRAHDVILFYAKSKAHIVNDVRRPLESDSARIRYRHTDSDGRRYSLQSLTVPLRSESSARSYEFMGLRGAWRYTKEHMQSLYDRDRIVQLEPGGEPLLKRYLDEVPGTTLSDVWDDVSPIGSLSSERLGYPTQKPLALSERIIELSSNTADLVLDPFCGTGTTLVAAQRLNRRWFGIDINYLSIALTEYRLETTFPHLKHRVLGTPSDIDAARHLATEDRYQFEWWALSLVGARPVRGGSESISDRSGRSGQADGIIAFTDPVTGKSGKVLVEVKSGKISPTDIRHLEYMIQQESNALGVLITLVEPSRLVLEAAIDAGSYYSADESYPRLQILPIRSLLRGARIDMPPRNPIEQ